MGDKHDPRKANVYFTVGTAFSALATGATGVQAQEQEAEDLALEEVLVTATRRGALNLQDVPIAITAFTEETITVQGFKTLDDYFSQIPSLTFGRVEPGGTTVIMRGCAISGFAYGDNPTTGVYLDDQPITAAGFNPDPRLVDIERVEALAGPQGTTFGDASQCGTLRIITNKPRLDENSAWVDLTGTAVDDGETGYDVSAMLNLPLGDTVAVRLVGFSARDAGYIDNILGLSPRETFDNAAFVADDVNTADVYGGRAALRWAPLDNWTFDLQGVYQKTEQDGFGDADINDNYFAGRNIGEWEQLRFNRETFDDEWYQFAGTAEGDFGWGVLTATGSYFKREARQTPDSTTYLQGFQQINDYIRAYYNPYATIYDFGGDPRGDILYDTETKRQTLEIRLSTTDELSSKWSALVGAFYNKNESPRAAFTSNVPGMSDNCTDSYAYNPGCSGTFSYLSYLQYYYFGTFAKPSDNWWTGVYESELTSAAVFGEWTYNFTDRFSITLGGRWYDIENKRLLIQGALVEPRGNLFPNCGTDADRAAWQVDGIPQTGFDLCFTSFRAEAKEDGFVPKLNATWFWQDEKMIYFTYSEGFRRGGANGGRRGSIFSAGGLFDAYESDTLKNYEIGSKNTLLDGRLQLNATFYHMQWEDIQIQAQDPFGLYAVGILNFPQADIDGLEADFSWRATENFSLSGTLGYNKAELAEDAILFPGTVAERTALKGTRLPLMPKWKTSLTGRYNFSNTLWNAQPYVLGTWTYQDETLNSLAGIQASVIQAEPRQTPSFNIFNLRFGLSGEDWTAALFVDNVFNEYAVTFFSERYTQTRATVLPPRTIGINFRKDFNW